MITAFASGTQTATGASEDFLSSPNVQGKFQLYLDMNAMQANDVLELRVYKMVLTGGTSRVVAVMTYYGVQPTDAKIAISDWIANELTDTNAVRFSLNQTFGTGRAYPWAVLKDDALTPTTTGRTLDVTATGAAGVDWGNVENQSTNVQLTATNIDSDQVVASVTGAVGSVTGAVGSVTGNVGGNVTGSVGSVAGNVGGNVVGSVASVTGNVGGNVTGSVGSVVADVGITQTGADKVWASASRTLTSMGTLVADIWAFVIEGAVTAAQSLRLNNAAQGGKTSGMDTGAPAVIRDIGDTKDRVSATVDANGNRTAVTLDLT